MLLILLLILVIFAWPRWGYSANWGYGPPGILGFLLLIVLILLILGYPVGYPWHYH